nr:hypothetical protein [Allomuricauda sp.]
MKRKKHLTLIVAIGIVTAVTTFLTLSYMFKPHRNIAGERAIASISATELHDTFVNSNGSSVSLANKTIEVNGSITEIEQLRTVYIDNKVQVDFDTQKQAGVVFVNGSNIKIKGRCIGFDDLLEIVKIDQAVLIKN